MQATPLILVHLVSALAATALGPLVFWTRRRAAPRPRLHIALGGLWLGLMLTTIGTAMVMRDFRLPNVGGITPIHLLIPVTLFGLGRSFYLLWRGDPAGHRRQMQQVYVGACLVAGLFTLLPGRLLGSRLWALVGAT